MCTGYFLLETSLIPYVQEIVLNSKQPHKWLRTASDGYSATVKILDSKILGEGVVEHLFSMNVDPAIADEMLAEIGKDTDVIEMETLKSKGGRVHGSISTNHCTICKEVAKSKCFLASVAIHKGAAEWTILGNHESFRELLASLEKHGIQFNLRLKKDLNQTELLTARQEQILLMAFERGYFDFPKKVHLKELAKETGMEPSTLTEILRRAQKKILSEYLGSREFQHPH